MSIVVPKADPVLAKLAASVGEQGSFICGQKIFTQGDAGHQLYIIQSGKVKIGRCTADGREHLLSICGPADMFGELSVFDPGPRASTATAVTNVSAVSVGRTALRKQINAHPKLGEYMLRVVGAPGTALQQHGWRRDLRGCSSTCGQGAAGARDALR